MSGYAQHVGPVRPDDAYGSTESAFSTHEPYVLRMSVDDRNVWMYGQPPSLMGVSGCGLSWQSSMRMALPVALRSDDHSDAFVWPGLAQPSSFTESKPNAASAATSPASPASPTVSPAPQQ